MSPPVAVDCEISIKLVNGVQCRIDIRDNFLGLQPGRKWGGRMELDCIAKSEESHLTGEC